MALFANAASISACRDLLASTLNYGSDTFTVWSKRHSWQLGYTQWRPERLVRQTTPIAQMTGEPYLDFVCSDFCVRVHSSGQIELRDGWDLTAKNQIDAGTILDTVTPVIFSMAAIMHQELIRSTIQKLGSVENTQYSNDTLIMEVEIPV